MDDFEKLINASDLIEWIMETYPDWCVGTVRSIVDHVEDMPSKQPEIIRCRDCGYWETYPSCSVYRDLRVCKCWFGRITTEADDFCSRAERRNDG